MKYIFNSRNWVRDWAWSSVIACLPNALKVLVWATAEQNKNKPSCGIGEGVQCLRAWNAFAEDLHLVPRPVLIDHSHLQLLLSCIWHPWTSTGSYFHVHLPRHMQRHVQVHTQSPIMPVPVHLTPLDFHRQLRSCASTQTHAHTYTNTHK